MPESPWIMTQTWNDLLFAHWPVAPTAVVRKIPAGLELETFGGHAWIGVVPFHMTNVAPRCVPPLPWLSAFAELNVRTYVRFGDKPGVYFFSLDADNSVAVAAARSTFHLPYYTATMAVERREREIRFQSARTGVDLPPTLRIAYRPDGDIFHAAPGSLDYFLTERYCLYTEDTSGNLLRVDIHHPEWPLQRAVAEIAVNTMTAPLGIALPAAKPIVHFAARQDVVAWAPSTVSRQ